MHEQSVIVWDLETVPDLKAAARMFGMVGEPEQDVRKALGTGFPKLPIHSIACIGALVARRDGDAWQVAALGAPHIGERSEAQLIRAFLERIDQLRPHLVTYNGNGFDFPVLRLRAMLHRIPAPGLTARPYFKRYTTDATDLCEALNSFGSGNNRLKLDEVSRFLGLAGKPDGVDGGKVEEQVAQGRIEDVARYCETDVVNTYRLWLSYELFRGSLTLAAYEASEAQLREFVLTNKTGNAHLMDTFGPKQTSSS